jgi:hypothetical protein
MLEGSGYFFEDKKFTFLPVLLNSFTTQYYCNFLPMPLHQVYSTY